MRTSRPSRGQALAEFALVLPLILFIVVGSIGLHILLIDRGTIQFAVQQTAVAVAESEGDCSVAEARFQQLARQAGTVECKVTGAVVEVSVSVPFTPLIPMLPNRILANARAWVPAG